MFRRKKIWVREDDGNYKRNVEIKKKEERGLYIEIDIKIIIINCR